MSDTIELCALRDGFWDLISTYDASQEKIAIQEAANIQTGYAAVAVLSVEQMHVSYYISLKGMPKPSYYDIRKSVKAERPTMREKSNAKKTIGAPKKQTTAHAGNTAPSPAAQMKTETQGAGSRKEAPQSFWDMIIESIYYLITGKKLSEQDEQKPKDTTHPQAAPFPDEATKDDDDTAQERNIQNLLEAHLEEEFNTPKETDTTEPPEILEMEDEIPTAAQISKKNPFKPQGAKTEDGPNPLTKSAQKEQQVLHGQSDEKKAINLKNTNAALPKIGGGHIPNPTAQNAQQNGNGNNNQFWNNIEEGEEDFEQARHQIQKSLFEAIERAKQLAWLPEQGVMRGTLQIAAILLICGIGRKLCSHVGLPGGIGNQAIGHTLEQLGLSEKQAFICALHVDRILTEPKNNLMYLIGRAYGANILNDSEQRIDLLSIFNAWENDDLERFFEVDEEKNTTKLSKLPYLKPISIMLTDIVSFTAQSNEKGEKWVKDVVHAHNRMTKTVAVHQKGEYIQGTGDGALLIFTTPESAMHAAMELQFMHQNFCRRVSSRKFDIRIAISHGIPIQTQSGLHGPAIEELNIIHRSMDSDGIAVTKGIASVAEQHGFQFNLQDEEASVPIYEFTTYTGAHTVENTGDIIPEIEPTEAVSVTDALQQEGQA
ncbi:MAG: adenylate/guanylate cyclase domain-containing protein [Pseudomonadota bacterium]|nr:adenylate/guanylate cyclase domain-containing protein [Pseudomonadota bacterium]